MAKGKLGPTGHLSSRGLRRRSRARALTSSARAKVAWIGLEARLRAVGRGRGLVLRRDVTPAVAEKKQTQRARRNANGERIWELNSHRGYNAPIGQKNGTRGPVWWCLAPARSGTRVPREPQPADGTTPGSGELCRNETPTPAATALAPHRQLPCLMPRSHVACRRRDYHARHASALPEESHTATAGVTSRRSTDPRSHPTARSRASNPNHAALVRALLVSARARERRRKPRELKWPAGPEFALCHSRRPQPSSSVNATSSNPPALPKPSAHRGPPAQPPLASLRRPFVLRRTSLTSLRNGAHMHLVAIKTTSGASEKRKERLGPTRATLARKPYQERANGPVACSLPEGGVLSAPGWTS